MLDTFATEFRKVFRLWRTTFEQEMRIRGLSGPRALALLYLSEAKEPLTQKDLAKLLAIEEPTLVRMLDGLNERGLIERTVGNRDRRTKIISLTDKAMPVLASVKEGVQVVRVNALGNINLDDLISATRVMKAIAANLTKDSD